MDPDQLDAAAARVARVARTADLVRAAAAAHALPLPTSGEVTA